MQPKLFIVARVSVCSARGAVWSRNRPPFWKSSIFAIVALVFLLQLSGHVEIRGQLERQLLDSLGSHGG